MKINENEKALVKELCDLPANVFKAQQYLKENYNVDSEFDEDNLDIHLSVKDGNNALMLVAAKEYINENLDIVNVIYG